MRRDPSTGPRVEVRDPQIKTVPIPLRGVDHTKTFSNLASTVPLLLMPVRLETRFAAGDLKVRIYPDQIHLDEHRRDLTTAERDLGMAYWTSRLAATTSDERAAATAWLVQRLPARRAAYVAQRMRPEVTGNAPPSFPQITPVDAPPPATAKGLPGRWAIVGWVGGTQRFVEFARNAVKTELAFAPRFEDAVPWSSAEGALPVDKDLAWMVDYDRAIAAGMAITVDLEPDLLADIREHGVTLLAIGVRVEDPADGARRVAELLEAHHYSDGLELLPQGTPTNNTDETTAGWTADIDDVDDLFARELDGQRAATAPGADGIRLARALGLPAPAVLARLPHATEASDDAAASMNRVLWPATWGRYVSDLLAPEGGTSVVSPSAIETLREWFATNVRGGAHFPTLAIGSQPYGILPVRRTDPHPRPSSVPSLEPTLIALRERWRDSVASVPRLDPVAGDEIGSDPDDDLVTILGTVPHPSRFVVRRLTYQREIRLVFWKMILWALERTPYVDLGKRFHALESSMRDVESELTALATLRAEIPSLAPNHQDDARTLVDGMISMTEAHRARQDPHQSLFPALSSGLFNDKVVTDPKLFWSGYGTATEDRVFTRPLVEVDNAAPGARADDYLAALRDRIAVVGRGSPVLGSAPETKTTPLTAAFHANEPLLYQLLDPVIGSVADREKYRAALATLQRLSSDDLELRFREALGLASHRLDAWITSLARQRLDEMRSKVTGLQIGGFGWVEDLRPDQAGTRESQGFIHAPSLAHATTAAVLRSGWTAHGSDPASPMAVDLRSDRMRVAAWLLDGIRAGSSLGDLLGCRFERSLHEAPELIDDCRRAALASQGITSDPRGPVDGMTLLDLYRAGTLTIRGTRLTATSSPAEPALAIVKDALDDLLAAFDAVGDAATADAVHHVLQGNRDRATATLDAISTGEVAPPELTFASTPRPGVGIVHRVVVTFAAEDSADTGWGRGTRAAVCRGLEAWCARLLGAPGRIGCTVRFAGGRAPVPITMADLVADQQVSALDLVFEVAQVGDETWSRRVRACVLARDGMAQDEGGLEIDLATGGDISFEEAAELARSLHALISRSRPLDARDLALPTADDKPGWNVAEAEARVATTAAALGHAVDRLAAALPAPSEPEPHPIGDGPLRQVRNRMAELAGFGLPGAIAVVGHLEASRGALFAEAWSLLDAARARLAKLATLDAASAAADAVTAPSKEERIRRAGERLAIVVGRGLPLIPRILPAARAELVTAFAHGTTLVADDPDATSGWLHEMARVRAPSAVLADTLALAELLGEGTLPVPSIAQLPASESDGWVARSAPADPTQGRLAMFAIDHGGLAALAAEQPISGLVVDSWAERVPAPDGVSGVALHFDAPSSRPPQALLLVVPPSGETWSFDLVVDSVAETMELARIRAVDPDILAGYGHQLPAIFPPGSIDAGPQPEAT